MNDEEQSTKISWLDRPVTKAFPGFSWEKLILTVIIILAVLSRFILIGSRVMSHDEINHVTPAYSLYQGNGYAHNPVTHGPFQFHMLALSYFLLGDSDFSSPCTGSPFQSGSGGFCALCFPPLSRPGRDLAGRFVLPGFTVYPLLWTLHPQRSFHRTLRRDDVLRLFPLLRKT